MGGVNHAHSTASELFSDDIASQNLAGALRPIQPALFNRALSLARRQNFIGQIRRRLGEKVTRLLMRAQQRLEFRPQRLVTIARLIQKTSPFAWFPLQGKVKQFVDVLKTLGGHCACPCPSSS